MTELTLISYDLCPYVQRASIALQEKGIPFKRINIDLNNKPDWFLEISPRGKVPLLKLEDGAVLFESSVICEYLEDRYPNPLHPRDPIARAGHRAWMEFGTAVLGDIWHLETTGDEAVYHQRAAAIRQKFQRVEDVLQDGPYFAGTTFSLVDAVFGPVFRYFDLFDQLADHGIFDDLPKIRAWRSALADRTSIHDAVAPTYLDRLRSFLADHDAYLLRQAREEALA